MRLTLQWRMNPPGLVRFDDFDDHVANRFFWRLKDLLREWSRL